MSNMTKVAKNLKKALDDSEKRKPNAYDTEAEVVGAEDNSLWVKFPGGETATPIRKTMDAKAGDKIMVRVSGHRAWAIGNETSPPTDDTMANAVAVAAKPSIDFVKALEDKDVTVRSIAATTGYINDLYSKNITTENLWATTGYIADLTSENITAQNIVADHETVGSLDANYAHITNGVIDNARIGYADVNDLNAHYAQIDIANVNNAWIENGAIKKAEVFDENVFDLSGDHATLSKIDASKINVANLRADNLVVRRINGQPVVGGYTLIDSNSSGYSSKNPQALGWYEFVNAQWVLSTDTTVDMTKAYYQTGNEVSLYDQAYIDGLEDDLQQQIDGAVETFTGSVVPTLTNYPYTDWYDTSVTPVHDERAKHVGDIYYVVNSASDKNGYCYRFAYDNTSHAYSWVLIKDSDVTKALSDISELQTFESTTASWMDETDEGLETIRTNHTALAGVVDKTVKESVQLWFTKANTTAPNKPTAEVTSTSTAGNAWRKVVPAYNASYPNYYYCWQYKFVDGTFDWSDVVRDIAMGETQGTSRDAKNTADAALPASTFTSFESTTFKDVKDTVTEHSTKFTNMTSRLGLNSDGTGANTDIVAKESALEATVDGISTRVGKTETKLIGMYATSSTAAGTAAKVATITPALPSGATWELGTGTIITVKFTNANTTSSPTLNVNSKGAKAIKTYANGNLSEAEYKWAAGSTFTFVYNGTNWLMQDSSVSVRMNSAETSITQNAEQIQTKASQSSVDSLSGRVSTAESTITQQATAIEAKVSKDGVIASINASVEEQGGSAVKISADKVNIQGVITAINNDSTTTINGNKITTGTLLASDIYIGSDVLTNVIDNAQTTADGAQASADNAQATADDAKTIATDTAQYFWFASSGTDTGAHISEQTRADFESNPSGGNLLANSNGIAVRDGMTELAIFSDTIRLGASSGQRVSISSGALEMYDSGNTRRVRVNASEGVTLGHPSEGRAVITDQGMTIYDANNADVAFYGSTARIGAIANSKTRVELSNATMNIISRNSSGTDATLASFGTETVIRSSDGTELAHFGYESGSGFDGTATAPYYNLGYRSTTSSRGNLTSKGNYSLASGASNIASGFCSHAEGFGSEASGYVSHAEGTSFAEAERAHAEGHGCIAANPYSHAEGYYCHAAGDSSHAEGFMCVTGSAHSHASGIGTHSFRQGQTVVGMYNVLNAQSLFLVGNGTSDSARSDAFWVNPDGSAVSAAGMLTQNGQAKVPDVFYRPPASESYGCIVRLWGDGYPNQSHSADTYWLGVGSSGKLYTGTQINGATAITWREK